MTKLTPLYQLPYLEGIDTGRRIREVSQALAQKLEAVLANEGQMPLDAELVDLLERLAAVEDALLRPSGPVLARGSVKAAANGGAAAPIYYSGLTTVAFPAGLFTQPPRVIAQTRSVPGSVVMGAHAESITKDGFATRAIRIGADPAAVDTWVDWIAVAV